MTEIEKKLSDLGLYHLKNNKQKLLDEIDKRINEYDKRRSECKDLKKELFKIYSTENNI